MKKIYRLWDAADSAASSGLNKAFCRVKTTRCLDSLRSLCPLTHVCKVSRLKRVNVMSEAKTYSGRCLCGAVSFTAEGVNGEVHACHCATCRKWSGVSMLAMGTAAVDFTGASNIAVTTRLSGRSVASAETAGATCLPAKRRWQLHHVRRRIR